MSRGDTPPFGGLSVASHSLRRGLFNLYAPMLSYPVNGCNPVFAQP